MPSGDEGLTCIGEREVRSLTAHSPQGTVHKTRAPRCTARILPNHVVTTVLTPSAEENAIYECTVLLSPSLSPQEVQGVVRQIEQEAAELHGSVRDRDLWGRRGLAYPIGGHREGNFAVLYVEIPRGRVREFEKTLRLLKAVLRHLMVRVPPGYAPPKYSVLFEEWVKDRTRHQERALAQREEDLRREIVRKAASRATERPQVQAPALTEVDLEKKLEDIIADKELHL